MATILIAAIFPSFLTMEKAQAQFPGFASDNLKENIPRENNYNNFENGYNPNEVDYTTANSYDEERYDTTNSYDDEPYYGQYDEPYYNNEDSYSNNDNEYYSKYPIKDNYKDKDPIVLVKKKLFVCDDAQNRPPQGIFSFECLDSTPFQIFPAGPDSREYIECTKELCPLIDESDFRAQLFKDVATITALSPQGTPVNLDKFHYTVVEVDLNDRTFQNDDCGPQGAGFNGAYELNYLTFTQDTSVRYSYCVNYGDDCEGTIHPGEVKTCTIENYIWSGTFNGIIGIAAENPITETTTTQSPNTATGATTTGTIPTESNNAITSQSNNAITTTPTTTQSSNVGVPTSTTTQSSNVGVETPNTFSSSPPSSPLVNILPSNPN